MRVNLAFDREGISGRVQACCPIEILLPKSSASLDPPVCVCWTSCVRACNL